MGLKHYKEILEKLFSLYPSAFTDDMPWMEAGHTIIDDGLMRMRFVLGPRYDYSFTGDDFFKLFTGVVFSALDGTCGTWIESFDIARWVPKQKEGEQMKRTQSRGKSEEKDPTKVWKKYPKGSRFCDEGIITDDTKPAEAFDIRGVMSYPYHREAVITYVIERMEHHPIPLGTQIIIDFDTEAPVQITRREGTNYNDAVRLEDHRHLFGEADMQMGLYTWLFRDNDVEIRSGDTDTLAVIGALLETADKPFKHKVIWSRGALRGAEQTKQVASVKAKARRIMEAKAKGKRLSEEMPDKARTQHKSIDLKALVDVMAMQGISMKVFIMIMCHGMGSDYNDKKNLAAQTNVNTLWMHMLAHKDKLNEICWESASLVQRDQACVWDQVLGHPGIQADYGVFVGIDFPKWKGKGDQDYTYKAAVEVLWWFWTNAPRRMDDTASLAAQEKGALMTMWGTSYWMFPWSVITKSAPSAFN